MFVWLRASIILGEKQTDIYVEVREMERDDGAGVSRCARLKPAKSRYTCY
jgi:hypothetical protein